jgi:hypothetical protein
MKEQSSIRSIKMNQYSNVDENGLTPSTLVKKMEVRENVVRSKKGVGMISS